MAPDSTTADPVVVQRERMVAHHIAEHRKHNRIRNQQVLRVMRITPRHLFVPASERRMAYEDCALPIGYGATISQPYIVALMSDLLAPTKEHRVLEVGSGSGYQTAILAQLAAQVYSLEIVPELAQCAARILRDQGIRNAVVREGDGYQGWPEEAPFDRIMITAAPTAIPAALIEQLRPGGRLVAPVGAASYQELILLDKGGDGRIVQRSCGEVVFVPMKKE